MFNSETQSKVMNFPGSAGGETNGLYAAVTEQEFFPADDGYLRDNSPPFFDVVSRAMSDAFALKRQYEQEKANANVKPQASPAAEWAAMSMFEKTGFMLAVFGVVYLLVRK